MVDIDLFTSPIRIKKIVLPLFPDILTSDENINKKLVLANHQLNEVEAVPSEDIEELP